jgi:hypothetical protein
MLDRLKTLLVKRSEPEQTAVTVYDTQKSTDKPIMKAICSRHFLGPEL